MAVGSGSDRLCLTSIISVLFVRRPKGVGNVEYVLTTIYICIDMLQWQTCGTKGEQWRMAMHCSLRNISKLRS